MKVIANEKKVCIRVTRTVTATVTAFLTGTRSPPATVWNRIYFDCNIILCFSLRACCIPMTWFFSCFLMTRSADPPMFWSPLCSDEQCKLRLRPVPVPFPVSSTYSLSDVWKVYGYVCFLICEIFYISLSDLSVFVLVRAAEDQSIEWVTSPWLTCASYGVFYLSRVDEFKRP